MLACAHRQPFFAVEPEQLLVVHLKAFPRQQDTQTAISEPATFIRQFAQPLAQGLIALILFLVLED